VPGEPQRPAAHRPLLVEDGERQVHEPDWWPDVPRDRGEGW
jgi:hypothetical protein